MDGSRQVQESPQPAGVSPVRNVVAEKFADALGMQLGLSTCSVKGDLTIYIPLSSGLTIPFKLKVISYFDAGIGMDAALLLEGPGDLLFFIGYSEKTKDLRTAVIDRTAMKRKPKDVMKSTGFVEIALKRLDDGGAVRGSWKQGGKKDSWKEV